MNTFLARLLWVLAEQEKYPWCDRIGVGAGRGNTMFGTRDKAATPPTAEALNAIMRYENVSISWLLDGKGKPCLVNTFASDAQAAEWVAAQLADTAWQVHVLTDRQSYALVLTRPDHYQVKDRHVDYTRVEIAAGALAAGTLAQVRAARQGQDCFRVLLSAPQLQALVNGQVSNLALLRRQDALLAQREPLADSDPLWQWPVASLVVLSPDEEQVLQQFRRMSPAQRQLFLKVAAVFAGNDSD